MKCRIFLSVIVTSLLLLVSGCAKDLPPGEYDASEIGKVKKVVPGVIISKRPVFLSSKPKPSDTGTISPSSADDIANSGTRKPGFEYVIRLNSGGIISVVQAEKLN